LLAVFWLSTKVNNTTVSYWSFAVLLSLFISFVVPLFAVESVIVASASLSFVELPLSGSKQ